MEEQEKVQDNVQVREKKKEKSIILSILILITLIIIIFLLIKYLGKIENNPMFPTGNIDIFDIIFVNKVNCPCGCDCAENPDKDCNCNMPDCICQKGGYYLGLTEDYDTSYNKSTNGKKGTLQGSKPNTSNNGGSSGSNNPSGGTNPDINGNNQNVSNTVGGQGDLEVFDRDVKFSQNTKLNIFKQTSYYVLEDKIAPTSQNTYQFVVRNNNNFDLKYSLEMFEENKYDINMKFRLRLNGNFIVGNDNEYVDVDKLNTYNLTLPVHTYDVYTLDWKWVESDNDTKVGTSVDAAYGLNLKVSAEQA